MAVTLSAREKKQWEEIKALVSKDSLRLSLDDHARMKPVLDLLEAQEYIKGLDVAGGYVYIATGNFDDFDDWLMDEEKKAKLLNFREWAIAIVSALIGAVIGRLV